MLRCIIMSGVSGAGKDTWIHKQDWFEDSIICSADRFFMGDGTYKFEASKLPGAHAMCLRLFIDACQNLNPNSVLVCNNTNTTTEEIAPYYSIAKAYGFEVEIVTLVVPPHIAAERNIHGVPRNSINAMHDRIQARKIPRFWDIKQYHFSTH